MMSEESISHGNEKHLGVLMQNQYDFENNYKVAENYLEQKDYYKAASNSLKAYKINNKEKKNILILLTSLAEISLFKEALVIAEQFLTDYPDDASIQQHHKELLSRLTQEYEKEQHLVEVENQISENKRLNSYMELSNKKKKILHIGGAHTTHLRDLLSEISRQRIYSQVIVSPSDRSMSKLLEEYPYYRLEYGISDNYTSNLTDKSKYFQIKSALKSILNYERPDVVHVHSLSAAVCVKAIREFSTIPIFINPWNILRIYNQNGIVYDLELEALSLVNKFIVPVREAFVQYMGVYSTLNMNVWLQSGYITEIDKTFQRDINDNIPKILCARQVDEKYYQHLLIESLPELINKYPQLRVTLMRGPNIEQGIEYFDYVVNLIERLGIEDHCKIVNDSISYNDFYQMIKDHNIIYSLYELDMGYSITNILGITSGAAVLSDNSFIKDLSIFKNGKNIFKTSINQKSILAELDKIISNLPEVLNTIPQNNKDFFSFGKDVLMPNLFSAYLEI